MSLGLIPAILSQTRRTLTKTLRIDTDYTTARAANLDNLDTSLSSIDSKIDTIDSKIDTIDSIVDSINTNVDVAVSSRLADTDAAARVQTGLNNNGYTTTVSGRIDTNISNRMAKHNTRTVVTGSGGGGTTIVSVGGTGTLHGITFTGNQFMVIVIDGVTVQSNTGISNPGGEHVVDGAGRAQDSGFNQGGAGSMGWEFKSSMSVSIGSSGGFNVVQVAYSLE